MVLRQSIIGGKRAAITSVLGNSSGLIIWGAASGIGLSEVFAHSHTAYNILKYAGVAFLIFLSLQTLFTLRHEHGKFDIKGGAKLGLGPAYRLGLLTNITNVKAAVSTIWYVGLVSAVDRAAAALAKRKVRRALTALSARGILFLALTLLFTSPR